jgi:hypothetical protein
MKSHAVSRDIVAALEKALAVALKEAGYEVMNRINCKQPLDKKLFDIVRAEFAADFPKLRSHLSKERDADPNRFATVGSA